MLWCPYLLLWAEFSYSAIALQAASTLHSFYREFNELINDRILSTAFNDERSSTEELPRINAQELLSLASNTNISRDWESFATSAALKRGCCFIEDTEDSNFSQALSTMWDVIQNDIFDDQSKVLDDTFRYEALQREENSNSGGYDYVHFDRSNKEVERMEYLVGLANVQQLQSSFDALSRIACAYTTVILSLCHKRSAAQLASGWTKSGFSFQRFARYRQPGETAPSEESLRPHCDWSLVTLIPVSKVPGLEIHTNAGWVRPEATNSSGVIVLTGKWLEILTGVESTIHRVVVRDDSSHQRCSAPFFFRIDGEMEGINMEESWSLQRKLASMQDCILQNLCS